MRRPLPRPQALVPAGTVRLLEASPRGPYPPYAAFHGDRAGHPTSLDDWIDAGFSLLAERGTTALRINKLCDRLGVIKGTFYWYFTHIRAYRAALVVAWGDVVDRERPPFAIMHEVAPRERMRVMMGSSCTPRIGPSNG